jgi:hypothetical protein
MVNYLALLEVKPKHISNPKTGFDVKFVLEKENIEEKVAPDKRKLEEDEDDEGEESVRGVAEEGEESVRGAEEKKHRTVIIDMRKHPANGVNRDLILKRLRLGPGAPAIEAPTVAAPTAVAPIIKPKTKVGPKADAVPEPDAESKADAAPEPEPKPVVRKITGKKVIIGKPFIFTKPQIAARLPKPTSKIIHKASAYYMNNRKISVEKLNKIFQPYRQEILDKSDELTCDDKDGVNFELLTHQKAVRDYLNLMTPYRGLLLLHALGSGKTCTSIAIAEGMKSEKRVFVMTPASLSKNFFSQLKDCGDHLYRKNQFWEFVSTDGQPQFEKLLSNALSLSMTYIEKHKGAWLVDVKKPANFTDLSTPEQNAIDEQLDEMIKNKYKEIHYNAPNIKKIFDELSEQSTINPFDNSVVLIDEAHNFVSRIVNQVKKTKTISYILYKYLMEATNVKIVMMTGTPIINYPNEIGILFNILRGAIKTWTFQLNVKEAVTTESFLRMFDAENFNTYDYVAYNNGTLTITRNPYGFINVKKNGFAKVSDAYAGVKLDETGNIINDVEFLKAIRLILKNAKIEIIETGKPNPEMNKALPDDADTFLNMFVDADDELIKNEQLFKRRVLGLTSHFPSTQDSLLPTLLKWTDETGVERDYEEVRVEMSDYQFTVYEKIREIERNKESSRKKNEKMGKKNKNDDLFKTTSSYRIRSRACCNFAFPDPPGRPLPSARKHGEEDEKEGDDDSEENAREEKKGEREKKGEEEKDEEVDEAEGAFEPNTVEYNERIQIALQYLADRPEEFLIPSKLKEFSPKFAEILNNLMDEDNVGLHLVYSQFRTVEGIGLLKVILEANGYAQFKIKKKSHSDWVIDQKDEDKLKPKFMLYTGTETEEEKDILLKIYNSQWEYVPSSITKEFEGIAENNHMGEIIKIIMITSSGAEGINLKNTRFVHIVEPYWHMVRVDQVIGRARRICSHSKLPEELRTVKVFLYLATFNLEKLKKIGNKTILEKDVSKIDGRPLSTDESLFETAGIKNRINQQLLKSVKESAFDCAVYSGINKDKLVCYNYGKIQSNDFGSHPSIEEDQHMKDELETKKVNIKVTKLTEAGVDYAYDKTKNEIYTMDNYQQAKTINAALVPIGRVVKVKNKNTIQWFSGNGPKL